MPTNNKCVVTIGSAISDPVIERKLKRILSLGEPLKNLNIITNTNLNMDQKKLKHIEIRNFELISDLISRLFRNQLEGQLFFEGISRDDFSTVEAYEFNSITYSSVTNKIALKLNQSTFRSTPDLSTIGSIRKLSSSKVGHGAGNMVSYTHVITINLQNRHEVPNILKVAVERIFRSCHLNVTFQDFDEIFFAPYKPIEINVISKKLNSNLKSCPSSAFIENFDEDSLSEFYEYLTLLHINSSQLAEDSDPYISCYEIPKDSLENAYQNLRRYFIKRAYSSIVSDVLKDTNRFCSLSFYFSDSHILLYSNPRDGQILIWEVD